MRLEQDGLGRDAHLAKLVVHEEAMLVVADQQGRGEADIGQVACCRLLQKRPLRDERLSPRS